MWRAGRRRLLFVLGLFVLVSWWEARSLQGGIDIVGIDRSHSPGQGTAGALGGWMDSGVRLQREELVSCMCGLYLCGEVFLFSGGLVFCIFVTPGQAFSLLPTQ